jgi:hypothetical protein
MIHLAPAPQGGVLALDLSGTVGLAYGPDEHDRPLLTAQFALPVIGGRGAKAAAAENLLDAIFAGYAPTRLVLATPLPLPALNNYGSAYQQFGLAWAAHAAAYRAECQVSAQDEQTVRSEMLGRPRYAKGGAKDAVLAYCRRMRIQVAGHHAADAAVLWLWHRSRVVGMTRDMVRERLPLLENALS